MTYDTIFLDVDDDGDLDILAYESSLSKPLYLNDSSGSFTRFDGRLPDEMTKALAGGDVDGDGDSDVLTGRTSNHYSYPPRWNTRLWSNVRRHLAWASLPQVGEPLLLDLYGRPDDAWILAYSQGLTNIPLGMGTLFLDPATLVVYGFGALDDTGRDTVSAPIPDDPGLIGTTIYWQAIIGSPMRLSNAEVTTLTGL